MSSPRAGSGPSPVSPELMLRPSLSAERPAGAHAWLADLPYLAVMDDRSGWRARLGAMARVYDI